MQRARLNPPVLYRHLLSLAMIVLTTILAGLMFDAFVVLGGSTRAAFGAAALLTLSPPLLIFSVLFFTELLSALVCFLVFYQMNLRDVRGTAYWWMARMPDRVPLHPALQEHRADGAPDRARALSACAIRRVAAKPSRSLRAQRCSSWSG